MIESGRRLVLQDLLESLYYAVYSRIVCVAVEGKMPVGAEMLHTDSAIGGMVRAYRRQSCVHQHAVPVDGDDSAVCQQVSIVVS